jgi:hypothetical protein
MKIIQRIMPVLAAAFLVAVPAHAVPSAVKGHYLEARTSDVYTGPCYANSEVNLVGKEAILAWRVDHGSWNGADLAGLSVVAVLSTRATLGDPYGGELAPEALVLVDRRASQAQREALVGLARELGGELLSHVRGVSAVPIEMEIGAQPGVARLAAGENGGAAAVATRALTHADHHCGNEIVYYDPLTATTAATPAVTLEHRFTGDGVEGSLGKTWSSPGKRSAFVGTFER